MLGFLEQIKRLFGYVRNRIQFRNKYLFEQLLENTSDCIYFKDRESRFVRASHQQAVNLGAESADELIGKTDFDFFSEEHARQAYNDEQKIISTGEPIIGIQEKETFSDGRVTWASTSKFPLIGPAGNIIGTVGISRDITARRKAEQELIKAKEEAVAAAKAKTQFLSTMSHEIRTPLNAVIGLSGILIDTKLTPEQYEFASTINYSGENLLSIINNILDFAKIDSGKLELEQTELSIAYLIEDVLGLVSATGAESKGIEFVYNIEEDVPDYIISDSTRIQQILVNLVNNAIKFTEEGEVIIKVKKVAETNNAVKLSFAVKDTGIGIPEDKMDRLFKQFSQVDASTTRKYGGTGLGLAICKRLVELLGGEISVTSEEGKGSKFTFTIKGKKCEKKLNVSPPQNLMGKRIFILDDNKSNRHILKIQCKKGGMEVKTFDDSKEFIAQIDDVKDFDLGILDMQMPGMDGLDVTVRLRERWDKNELPLVLLSSINEFTNSKHKSLVNLYLTKPIRQTLLLHNLERVLSNRDTTFQSRGKDGADKLHLDKSIKILVAEDNIINQKVAGKMLERLGYSYEVAANGVETVKMCKMIPFDLVLMDMEMPEMDGLEATIALEKCKDELPQHPVVIAMTANAMSEDEKRCLEAGMKDFLAKPVTLGELQKILYKWFPAQKAKDL